MPKKILLADDSITIQKVVELTFSDGDYEVTAVNNGAKAIQKLGEMRPDIILSDIIMPEKNGYEVCEYVKSHPEHRNIPVVLLTGTFEPFDPDRAEKAGCDAVVTKPFESQSLIHKVEELIASAKSAPAPVAAAPETAAAPASAPEASPWMEEEPPAAPGANEIPAPMPFTTSSGRMPALPESFAHDSDIFNAPPPPRATAEMPFDNTADTPFSGETRAFPRVEVDDFAQNPPSAEPAPWDEPDMGGETRAFDRMSVSDLESMQQPLEPEPQAASSDEGEAESPFGAPPPPETFSTETRAFPRLSFEDLQQQMATPAPEPEAEPEPQAAAPEASPWDEPAATPVFDETPATPSASFDEFQQSADYQTPAAEPQPEPQADASPWDEQPAFAGETRAFPKMSFDDLASMAPQPETQAAEPEPQPEPQPAWNEPEMPAWSDEGQVSSTSESFSTAAPTPFDAPEEPQQASEEAMPEDMPFVAGTTGDSELEGQPAAFSAQMTEPEPEPAPSPFGAQPFDEEPASASEGETAQAFAGEDAEPADAAPSIVPAPAEEPSWAPISAAEAAAEPEEPVVPPPALAPEAPPMAIRAADLTEEQVDRIARRVVEMLSDQVVRNIAWEVIPDLAEMVVKERIRQLESEA